MRPAGSDLISKARAGDGDAFRELTEPHRRELQVHRYRMLGSFADAEDALQDTLLAAWQGIGGFVEGRASLRTWLYRIATNRCLNALRSVSRRPAIQWDVPKVEPPEPTLPRKVPASVAHAATNTAPPRIVDTYLPRAGSYDPRSRGRRTPVTGETAELSRASTGEACVTNVAEHNAVSAPSGRSVASPYPRSTAKPGSTAGMGRELREGR